MNPTPTPDQAAAHEFLAELRTRIATQPLPYQYGIEESALESLWKLFDFAREAIRRHPGCECFAQRVTEMLNIEVRPITAKWDRAKSQGILRSRDGADVFRGDMDDLREDLVKYANDFHRMAYGTDFADLPTQPVMSDLQIEDLFKELPFGIATTSSGTVARGINSSEAAEVAARRAHFNIETRPGHNAVGIALSGGGIRSATFSLGVIQVLADRKLLENVDFLSTVSGGGYTGSFISSRLGRGAAVSEFASPCGPDTAAIRYLRQTARYLTSGGLWEKWGMVCATVAGTLLNWLIPLAILFACAATTVFSMTTAETAENPAGGGWRWIVPTVAVLLSAGALCYFNLRTGSRSRTAIGTAMAALAALSLLGICGFLVGLGFDRIFGFVDKEAWSTPATLLTAIHAETAGTRFSWTMITATIGGISMAVPAVLRFMPLLRRPKVRIIVLQVALTLCGLFIPLLGLAVYYGLCAFGKIGRVCDGFGDFAASGISGLELLIIAGAVIALVSFFLININLTGPHQLYRNGLARTFVKREEDPDDLLLLKDLNPSNRAPYHLINAAVNLPTSSQPGLNERKCDFFLFSKHWCGSPATGYQPTAEWRMNRQQPDLGTAMAISGAAFSSHMGLGSMPPLTALLTFLNVRLGFWIQRPKSFSWCGLHPGFLCLLREMTGTALSEKRSWLNLSDGGHIENLAAYELLRRRCKFIICVDGEADPAFTFQGLMTLVRHARIDFGVRIEPDLERIRPDPSTGLSQCHYHFCRIHYPALGDQPEGTGLLLYLKLSVTGNESELIKRYRINHPEFPHQSTLDQFFDQEQFEAYRQLGVHVAEGLFSNAISGDTPLPPDVRIWFEKLARNLLVPQSS